MLRSPAARSLAWYAPLLLVGSLSLLHLLQAVAGRIAYPYELEWMEGAMLHQVVQLLAGKPLYGEPSLEFVPALYMPLYYYFSAISVQLLGESLLSLRVVSVTAALLAHSLLFLIARRVSGSSLAALLAVFLFAWTYRHTGFWFDVARVDSLWTSLLALSALAVLNLRDRPGYVAELLVALCWLLALLAKQSTLFLLPFLCLALWSWCGFVSAFRVGAFFLLGSILLLLLLQFVHGEKFFFYVFGMASTHGVTGFGVRRFWEIVLFSIPVMLLVASLFPWLGAQTWRDRLGWFLLLVGFLVVSMISRAYAGAFYNVLMPLHFAVALFAALSFAALVRRQVQGSRWMILVLLVVIAVLSLELLRHRYDPRAQWPNAVSVAAHDYLVQHLAQVDGSVCVASHGYLGRLAGKDFCAHNTQVTDVMQGSDPALAARLREDARRRILAGEYAVIVLDREKELNDLGLQLAEIPYTVSSIDYPQGPMQFPVNGRPPVLWLQYNGSTQHER